MNTASKWDSLADDWQRSFLRGESDYTVSLLKYLKDEGLLRPGCRVLDIGCGVGKYGVYFARLGCDVTLTDISAKMLQHAAENMAGFSSPWRTWQCSFDDVTGDEPVFSPPFDLSISTMSPAIHNLETVRKMSAVTGGFCFVSRYTQWEQENRDEYLAMLGLEDRDTGERASEQSCSELIDSVSALGYTPRMKYVDYNWCDMRTPEELTDIVLRRFGGTANSPDRNTALKTAESLCNEDGLFEDAVKTKVLWLSWSTKN
ncbi:MAG: class I SAM-dependent methyltransferase [Candidatus Limivicinus sp.]